MRIDAQTFMEAQRRAITYLSSPEIEVVKDGQVNRKKNKFFVPSQQITSPVRLRQELPFQNTDQVYEFNFANTAPAASATLNNVTLPKNNVAAIYAIQMLIGYGANANNREYYSHGLTTNDNAAYNSLLKMDVEDSKKVSLTSGEEFKDVYDSPLAVDSLSGVMIINPIRILSGEMGIWTVTLKINNPITALRLTPNAFLSLRLCCVMGQASGGATK